MTLDRSWGEVLMDVPWWWGESMRRLTERGVKPSGMLFELMLPVCLPGLTVRADEEVEGALVAAPWDLPTVLLRHMKFPGRMLLSLT